MKIVRMVFLTNLPRIVMLVVLGCLFALGISLRSDTHADTRDESRTVTDFLERLPTEPMLYFTLAAVVCLLLYRAWHQSAKLTREIDSQRESRRRSRLSSSDWWVVEELRKRSLNLRVRASFILFGIFTLLFAGIYLGDWSSCFTNYKAG